MVPTLNAAAPNGFGASNTIMSTYRQGNDSSTSGHVATLQLDMKTPGVSTSDQGAVSNVQCGNGQVTLTVPDAAHYQTAINWKTPMTLLVTNQWTCNGQQTNQLFSVTGVKGLNGNSTSKRSNLNQVQLTATPAQLKDHATNFNIDLSYDDQSGAVASKVKGRRTLGKRISVDKTSTFDLTANSDGNGKVKLPNIQIFKSSTNPQAIINCATCFTQGSATIKMSINGGVFPPKVNTAQMTLDGNMLINADFTITGDDKIAGITSPTIQLIDIPITPITIPGVFDLGPAIKLEGNAALSLDAKGTIAIGADMNFPNFHAVLDLVNNKNTEQSGFSPKVNPHVPDLTTLSIGVTGSLNLIPTVVMELNVLDGLFDVQAGVQMTGTLAAAIDESPIDQCKGISPEASIFLTGNVGAIVGGGVGNPKIIPAFQFPKDTLFSTCIAQPSGAASSAAVASTAASSSTSSAASSKVTPPPPAPTAAKDTAPPPASSSSSGGILSSVENGVSSAAGDVASAANSVGSAISSGFSSLFG